MFGLGLAIGAWLMDNSLERLTLVKGIRVADMALAYREAMRYPEMVDWEAANEAIIKKWSESALMRIKSLAWGAGK